MSLFLNLVSVSKAVEQVRSIAIRCGDESVPLSAALHRVLAQDVISDVDIPGLHPLGRGRFCRAGSRYHRFR